MRQGACFSGEAKFMVGPVKAWEPSGANLERLDDSLCMLYQPWNIHYMCTLTARVSQYQHHITSLLVVSVDRICMAHHPISNSPPLLPICTVHTCCIPLTRPHFLSAFFFLVFFMAPPCENHRLALEIVLILYTTIPGYVHMQ